MNDDRFRRELRGGRKLRNEEAQRLILIGEFEERVNSEGYPIECDSHDGKRRVRGLIVKMDEGHITVRVDAPIRQHRGMDTWMLGLPPPWDVYAVDVDARTVALSEDALKLAHGLLRWAAGMAEWCHQRQKERGSGT